MLITVLLNETNDEIMKKIRISIILSIQLIQVATKDFFIPLVLTATSILSFSLSSPTSSLERFYKRTRRSKRTRRNHKNHRQQQNNDNFRNQTIIIDTTNGPRGEEEMEKYVHRSLMDVALNQAMEAGKLGEVPIGAVVVKEVPVSSAEEEKEGDAVEQKQQHYHHQKRKYVILSNGQNQIETLHDASAHAELQALRAASYNIQNWRLINTTLYTTLEPCPMCLSAAQAFRVSKIVYGAPDMRLGAIKTHIQLLDIAKHPFHDTIDVVGGVKDEECGQLLIDFFRERRKNKKKNVLIPLNTTTVANGMKHGENGDSAVDKNVPTKKSFFRKLFRRLT